jgi:Zn-dependent protease with chaperone function
MGPSGRKPTDGQDPLRGMPDWLLKSLGDGAGAPATPPPADSPSGRRFGVRPTIADPKAPAASAVAMPPTRPAVASPRRSPTKSAAPTTPTTTKKAASTKSSPRQAKKAASPIPAVRTKAATPVPAASTTRKRSRTSPALSAGVASPQATAVAPQAERAATSVPIVTTDSRTTGVGLPPATGIPQQFSRPGQWFWSGLRRQPWATGLALLTSWTGFVLALWAGVIGLFLGGRVGAGMSSQTGSLQAVGGAVGVISVVGTALLGAGSFFAAVYIAELITHPSTIVGSLLGGAILAILLVAVIAHFEGDLLRLRGYRRPTRDEVRTIAPHVQAVGSAMKLSTFPRFVISDTANPGAWTHMRHIVITTGMIEMLEPDQLRAVIAHEMNHWRTGDAVALHFVWSCGWPIALMYNLGTMLSGTRPGEPQSGKVPRTILGLIGWAILWPAWIITKLVIAPAVAARSRREEYEADQAAAAMGLSEPLIGALQSIAMFEGGRSGWEVVMMATHPPTALRIEALQQPRPDDADYQEGPLGRLTVHIHE